MSATIAFDILARDRASDKFDKVAGSADRADSKLSKLARGVGKAGKATAIGLGIVALGGAKLAASSIEKASDLNETMSKSQVIFGKQASAMEKWADGAARSVGLSKNAALGAAAGFGDMLSQIGFTGKETAKTSKGIVQMAADLGSFNNLETDDVLDRISGALRGEYDSLQAVIPNINAARVEQQAMAMTGKKNAGALTAQEKAQATLAIITKDGARATGDFKRTSGGLANQQKILKAQLENVQAAIGRKLLPVAVKLASWANDKMIPAISRLWKWLSAKLGPVFSAIGKWITGTVLPAFQRLRDGMTKSGGGMDKVKKAFADAQPFFKLAKAALKAVGTVLSDVLWPILKKVSSVALPLMGKMLGAVGKAGISMWNVLAPVFRFILKAVGTQMVMWGKMLRTLAKVPGFGWAKKAGDAMSDAGNKAVGLAAKIKKIPPTKTVTIRGNPDPALAAIARVNYARIKDKSFTITTYYDAVRRDSNTAHFAPPPGSSRARAAGGPVRAGRVYRYQENGREEFVPEVDGRVLSARETRQMVTASPQAKQTIIENHFHISGALDPNGTARTIVKLLRDHKADLGDRPLGLT